MKVKAIIFALFVVLFSCRKDTGPNVVLDGTLTDCPANFTCNYNYFDNADFTTIKLPVQGNYRVFWYDSQNTVSCGTLIQFYFKIPLSSSSFEFSSNQIVAGEVVAQDEVCLCCGRATIGTEPISGEIKGKRTDATHWLINATIVFGTTFNKVPVDTLVVNQYFTSQKLP
jgi:hypothetical protein